ncbi:MAG TPA: thioredoxin family protein [Pseudonocardiaceae bacterium]|nr:thioredoxin family protein [Pseudonocardiaceae bacterium]
MTPALGVAAVLVTIVLATLGGLFWRRRQGRVRAARRATGTALPEPVLSRVDQTAAVTLLQLNSPVCARCPQAGMVLGELAQTTPGIRHTKLDLAEYPELAHELKVRSTPTTLVLSATGEELFRVAGVPRRDELRSALQPHL